MDLYGRRIVGAGTISEAMQRAGHGTPVHECLLYAEEGIGTSRGSHA